MGLILSEPMKKVVKIPKILAKFSVEDAKIHPKRPYRLRISPVKKGRKKHTKNISPVFSQKKTLFRESPVFLAALALRGTRSRQDESIDVGEVGSKRPSLVGGQWGAFRLVGWADLRLVGRCTHTAIASTPLAALLTAHCSLLTALLGCCCWFRFSSGAVLRASWGFLGGLLLPFAKNTAPRGGAAFFCVLPFGQLLLWPRPQLPPMPGLPQPPLRAVVELRGGGFVLLGRQKWSHIPPGGMGWGVWWSPGLTSTPKPLRCARPVH
jgi:hypothetical protein